METTELRKEFEKQLKEYSLEIKTAEEQLLKLREYKIKLEGGLETLSLLEKQSNSTESDGSDSSQHSD